MYDEQFKRLPKYAQNEIRFLKRERDVLLQQIRKLRDEATEDTEYYYMDYVGGERLKFPVPLDKYRPLNIKMNDGSIISVGKNDYYSDDLINIRGETGGLTVHPVTGNVVQIGVKERM